MISPHILLHSLVRGIDFLGVILLVGGLVFRMLVVSPRSRWILFLQRFLPLVLLAIGLGDLVLRSRMITGLPLVGIWAFLPTVLLKTHFGKAWMARSFLLCLLSGTSIKKIPKRIREGLALMAGGLLMLTVSLSGHAASSGDLSLAVLADWLHIMAVSAWMGGFFFLALVLRDWMMTPGLEASFPALFTLAKRFSNLAAVSVGLILATGSYQAWHQVGNLHALVQTPYGQTLMVKLLLFLPLLGFGVFNRYCILPRLSQATTPPSEASPGDAPRRLLNIVTLEIGLGVVIIACAALLSQLPPARSQGAAPFKVFSHPMGH